MKNFIKKLQNSNESAKKFWLVVLSGISMLIVISIWGIYIDKTIANVYEAKENPQPIAKVVEKQEPETPGFFAIFGAGVKTIFDALKNKLSVSNNIVIESSERNFVADEIEPVPTTNLP